MSSQVIILAGGLAKRLGKLTVNKPKSLILINETPFIIHQLRYLKKQGINRVHFCLGHLGEQILDTLESSNFLDFNITYSFDGNEQLGTGGAIKKALDYCDDIFFVQYGDTYLPINYNKILEFYCNLESKKNILTIYKNCNEYDKSNIVYEENRLFKYDKNIADKEMKYIDYGLSFLIKKDLCNIFEEGATDLSDVYKRLISNKEMLPYVVNERFYEIGKAEGIKETENYLKSVKY